MPRPLVTAARRHLMASGIPANLISLGLLGADPSGGAFADGWVFSGDLTGDPYRPIEGTATSAIVLHSYDDWAPSTLLHTARYPRLRITIYSDVSRDDDGNPSRGHDAENTAESIFLSINPLFHDAANRIHHFDTMPIISTVMGDGLTLMEMPDGDGAVMGTCSYDVTVA